MNDIVLQSKKNAVFPACFLEFPSGYEGRCASFYLAAEEYVARHLPEDNYLFTWQLSPTVVMGRNQVAHLEVDLDFCRAEGIQVMRRKSGGGCIYADLGNIMVSVITGSGAVEALFEEYAEKVAACLRRLGANVSVKGRNDIVLEGGGKICGNAFYHLTDRNIVHGTMLYDTDFRLMMNALTPDKAKLQSKGVKSVKSRIALLKDELNMTIEQLRDELRNQLTDRTIRMSQEDIENIEEIEKEYHTHDYLYGRSAHADVTLSERIDGCGNLSFHFSLKGSKIAKVEVLGDFFALEDVNNAFSLAFEGKEFSASILQESIQQHHPETSIRGLALEPLLHLFSDIG